MDSDTPPAGGAAPGRAADPSRLARLARAGLAAALTAGLWLLLLEFPIQAAAEQLDPSWRAILGHDLWTGARQGRDLIFTYGPLGYLLSPGAPYIGELYWWKVLGELGLRAIFAATLVGLAWRQAFGPGRAAALLVIAVLQPAMNLFLDLFVVGALALHAIVGLGRAARWIALATIVLIGLSKFSQLVQAGFVVLAIAAAEARHGWRRGVEAIAVASLAGLTLWLAHGQSLGDVPAWLAGSFDMARGYNEAMAIAGPPLWTWLMAIAGLGATGLALFAWRRGAPLSGLACVLVLLWIAWKSAVVRQDSGHAGVFLATLAASPLLLGMLPVRAGSPLVPRAASALLVGVGLFGLHATGDETSAYRSLRVPQHLAWRWSYNWRFLTNLRQARHVHEQIETALAAAHPLEETKRIVGRETIDNLTAQQGLLLLHDLTVRHRPVFQSYAAFTPRLQATNGEFFASDRAPRYVLLRLDAIDGRPPLMCDSQSYRQLLARYRPVGEERGFVLFERQAVAGEQPERVPEPRPARLGAWVDLPPRPGFVTLVSVEVEPSLAGRLRAFLYQPADLAFETRTASGRVDRWRITTAAMRLPAIVSPMCTDTKSFAALWGSEPGEDVVACRVLAPDAEWAFATDCRLAITWQARPR